MKKIAEGGEGMARKLPESSSPLHPDDLSFSF